ncbi:hypothetical protein I5M27_06710 [Adhaeribacter sp. BT258]|uniref:Uncharacterized protein n=1 Tax=Adhaeribacter terrigena TaxID=2793070 RepID=A0ABS1BZU2_9BACT|nr:hypothetical protein [Adhaeribacter terrigena]MBK0402669.1 hypothetical protein [Adhaeribacter terrigena]
MLIVLGFEVFLVWVDIYYVAREVIWPVYLADAVVEIILILLWLWWWFRKKPALPASAK